MKGSYLQGKIATILDLRISQRANKQYESGEDTRIGIKIISSLDLSPTQNAIGGRNVTYLWKTHETNEGNEVVDVVRMTEVEFGSLTARSNIRPLSVRVHALRRTS